MGPSLAGVGEQTLIAHLTRKECVLLLLLTMGAAFLKRNKCEKQNYNLAPVRFIPSISLFCKLFEVLIVCLSDTIHLIHFLRHWGK